MIVIWFLTNREGNQSSLRNLCKHSSELSMQEVEEEVVSDDRKSHGYKTTDTKTMVDFDDIAINASNSTEGNVGN